MRNGYLFFGGASVLGFLNDRIFFFGGGVGVTAYLASLAVIGGARSWTDVKKTVKGGFTPVIRVLLSVLSLLLSCVIDRSITAGHVGQLPTVPRICSEIPLA